MDDVQPDRKINPDSRLISWLLEHFMNGHMIVLTKETTIIHKELLLLTKAASKTMVVENDSIFFYFIEMNALYFSSIMFFI